MRVLLGMEWRLEDCMRVAVVGNHNVLLAAVKANGGAGGFVCV